MSRQPLFSQVESTVYEQLAGPGYVLFEGEDGLPPPPGMCDKLYKLDHEPIPNAPDLGPGDGKRQQCTSTSTTVIRECKSLLDAFARQKGLMCGGKTIANVRSLWSDATLGYDVHREGRQEGDGPEHADTAAPGSLRGEPTVHIPCALIWAVQKGTRLRVRPFGGEWTIIYLKPGDVLVFCGDLCHNGLGYPEPNIRVHAYIDSPVIKRKPNHLYGGC